MVTVCHAVHTITWPFSTPSGRCLLFVPLEGGGGGAVSHGVIFLLLVLANVTWPALATGVWQSSIAFEDLFRLLARCFVLLGIFSSSCHVTRTLVACEVSLVVPSSRCCDS